MTAQQVSIKEILAEKTDTLEIESVLYTPFLVKEVFELRYEVLPARTIVGNNCVAYFGEIGIKAYCVKDDDMSLRLVEQSLHYKGFAFFPKEEIAQKPQVTLQTEVQDLFTDANNSEDTKIYALLSTRVMLSREREIDREELENSQGSGDVHTGGTPELIIHTFDVDS